MITGPSAHGSPAVAALTAYVDPEGRTLLVLAAMPGREPRVFATEHRPRLRPLPGAPPPAPPAEERAEAWAREMGACEVAWGAPRPVRVMGGLPALEAAMAAVEGDLVWQREQRERRASHG